jgi:lycopene beta-cyclase
VGLEVELDRPPPLAHPVVMDATVEQIDGYRFLYLLPLGGRRLLAEDTYFADQPSLDRERLRARVRDYLARRGLQVAAVVREESGVLPMPWADPGPALDRPLAVGYRGGWFHPATGYSFPVAVRLAERFAAAAPAPPSAGALADLRRRHRAQARFARGLNWLLFRAVEPAQRWRVFARFYRLPEPTIRRFYALDTTPLDRARVLAGRPPRGLVWPWGRGEGTHPRRA